MWMWVIKKYIDIYGKALPIFKIFSKNDKKYFIYIILIQSLIALMDIVGIFLVGIVGTIITNYLLGSNLNSWALNFINLLGLNNYSVKFLILFFSLFIVIFFVSSF